MRPASFAAVVAASGAATAITFFYEGEPADNNNCIATDHGGNDTDRGSVRFLQWTTDPEPADTAYFVDFAILIRDLKGNMRVEHDRHTYGLFARQAWRRLLRDVGFELKTKRAVTDDLGRDVFVGHRGR